MYQDDREILWILTAFTRLREKVEVTEEEERFPSQLVAAFPHFVNLHGKKSLEMIEHFHEEGYWTMSIVL